MKKILIAPALLLLLSCAENKNVQSTNSTANSSESTNSTKTIEGEVAEIKQGKDGYTAKIKTDNEIYFVTVSRANLKDPMQYKTVKEGETLKVSGDFWKMENENQITARELF